MLILGFVDLDELKVLKSDSGIEKSELKVQGRLRKKQNVLIETVRHQLESWKLHYHDYITPEGAPNHRENQPILAGKGGQNATTEYI
jgi:hypothetical protein